MELKAGREGVAGLPRLECILPSFSASENFVFNLAHEMSALLGFVGVVVDAKLEAAAFYERYWLVALEAEAGHLSDRPEPSPMFLEIGAIPKPTAAR